MATPTFGSEPDRALTTSCGVSERGGPPRCAGAGRCAERGRAKARIRAPVAGDVALRERKIMEPPVAGSVGPSILALGPQKSILQIGLHRRVVRVLANRHLLVDILPDDQNTLVECRLETIPSETPCSRERS